MNEQAFNTPADLVKYVNDNSIVQAKIVMIIQRTGQWFLFWYT